MVKRAVAISLAFIGVVVGAGFASGQEAMQYFVAFGEKGFFGVVLGAALMMITGIAVPHRLPPVGDPLLRRCAGCA